MMISWYIILPFLGGLLAWLAGRRHAAAARWVSVAVLAVDLLMVIVGWLLYFPAAGGKETGPWLMEFQHPWVPQLGVGFHLGLDGLSLLLILLTLFLGIIAVLGSWKEIDRRVGFFHLNLLWTLSGVIGVFLALDLFLFYFFWELMLVPMYFLIALWGHENRAYASVKFFIFTQLGSLLMLLSIIGLYIVHGQTTGHYTFDYQQLLQTDMSPQLSFWLMLGFFIAFAVKIPMVPLHTWLADAHTAAPTAGSVILAGLLLKTGAYGLIRFLFPFFPEAAASISGLGMVLGVVGIIYGALLAFAQQDLKRLIAYTSISHMGFVLLGLFAGNEAAFQGAVIQMICHGISTGGLFIIAGALQERLRTRDMEKMGGLWSVMPGMGGCALVLALASLGLPGLGNFVGEFLILLGVFPDHPGLAALAASGLVAAAVYALWLVQKVFFGQAGAGLIIADATARELAILSVMIALLLILGLYPQPLLDTARPALAVLGEVHGYSPKAGLNLRPAGIPLAEKGTGSP